MSCVFCDIVSGDIPCHKIWEDASHLAFLSSRPNTSGFSVVIPKKHLSSYLFAQQQDDINALIYASKQVGLLLDRALDGVARTGMIFEGYGVDHLHAKLFPMHGTGDSSEFKKISSNVDKYFDHYEGYISSHDGKREDYDKLARLAAHIGGISHA